MLLEFYLSVWGEMDKDAQKRYPNLTKRVVKRCAVFRAPRELLYENDDNAWRALAAQAMRDHNITGDSLEVSVVFKSKDRGRFSSEVWRGKVTV